MGLSLSQYIIFYTRTQNCNQLVSDFWLDTRKIMFLGVKCSQNQSFLGRLRSNLVLKGKHRAALGSSTFKCLFWLHHISICSQLLWRTLVLSRTCRLGCCPSCSLLLKNGASLAGLCWIFEVLELCWLSWNSSCLLYLSSNH